MTIISSQTLIQSNLPPGPSGYSGTSGTSGANGSPGSPGSSGISGYSGTSGANGSPGSPGSSGISGYSGTSGATGSSGYSGSMSNLSGYSGADYVGFIGGSQSSGYSGRTVASKLRDIVSVKDFGAIGNGSANDAVAIQNAINAVSLTGGGKVYFPQGKYNIGTTGLITYQNIILCGEVTRYAAATTRGTSLIYSGTGSAIYGQYLLDTQILDMDIDCSGVTGSSARGIWFNGAWKSTIRNVTIRELTEAKGYAILIDTLGGVHGAQHNYLEQIETADGVIYFQGDNGSSGVTTTVCNTIRGMKYKVLSSQITFINSTAENWTSGAGYDFSGAGCYCLMLGCDIENNSGPAISIDSNAVVREYGTIWAGFTGTKISGNISSPTYLVKPITTSSTSPTPIFTVTVPNGQGLRLSAHANGIQNGDNWYSNTRDCVVANAAGTLLITQGTQLTAGSAGSITFVDVGSGNIQVQWTPTTANASTGNMNLEIRGPWVNYS